ncbi:MULTISPECIES: SRPBCC family protein [Erwinia]|uniref:SRPBCC family protein n=1 Tax=Erwinia TaxID=551 RepID=UPI00055421C8|nr:MULTISPECIES: SRPBCC family protein [Erwinia]
MSHTAYASRIIAATPAQIWPFLSDFNGLPRIHPGISHSELEQGVTETAVGAVRKLTLPDGFVRERLLKLDVSGWELHYAIIEGVMPVTDYVAVVKLSPKDDGTTLAEWWADFDVPDGVDKADVAQEVSEGVFATCLQNVALLVGGA